MLKFEYKLFSLALQFIPLFIYYFIASYATQDLLFHLRQNSYPMVFIYMKSRQLLLLRQIII